MRAGVTKAHAGHSRQRTPKKKVELDMMEWSAVEPDTRMSADAQVEGQTESEPSPPTKPISFADRIYSAAKTTREAYQEKLAELKAIFVTRPMELDHNGDDVFVGDDEDTTIVGGMEVDDDEMEALSRSLAFNWVPWTDRDVTMTDADETSATSTPPSTGGCALPTFALSSLSAAQLGSTPSTPCPPPKLRAVNRMPTMSGFRADKGHGKKMAVATTTTATNGESSGSQQTVVDAVPAAPAVVVSPAVAASPAVVASPVEPVVSGSGSVEPADAASASASASAFASASASASVVPAPSALEVEEPVASSSPAQGPAPEQVGLPESPSPVAASAVLAPIEATAAPSPASVPEAEVTPPVAGPVGPAPPVVAASSPSAPSSFAAGPVVPALPAAAGPLAGAKEVSSKDRIKELKKLSFKYNASVRGPPTEASLEAHIDSFLEGLGALGFKSLKKRGAAATHLESARKMAKKVKQSKVDMDLGRVRSEVEQSLL